MGVSRVANALYESATIDKNVTAQIFYLKNRSENWADKVDTNINVNIKDALSNAQARIIDHQETQQLSLKDVKD